MQRQAGDEEIERLIQQLYDAMDALAEGAGRADEGSGGTPPHAWSRRRRWIPTTPSPATTCRRCSTRFARWRKNGQREEAKRLLEELRKMMENATPMMARPSQQRAAAPAAASRGQGNQQGREMMNQLDRLSRRQNQLLGEIRARGPPAAGPPGPAGSAAASRASKASSGQQGQQGQGQQPGDGQWGEQQRGQQEGLRRQLGELHEQARRERHADARVAGPRRALDARGRGRAAPRRSARGVALPAPRARQPAAGHGRHGRADAPTADRATARTSPRSRSASGAARIAIRSAAPTATTATRSTPASTRCRSSSSASAAARSSTSCAAAPASSSGRRTELDYIDRLLGA